MSVFLDKAKIKILSGKGGNGAVAWRREKYVDKGGPAGGDGGRGGDVYFIADADMTTLMDFQYQSIFKAENGENGRPKSQHGRGGKDLYIKVPLGTVVKDPENDKIIADLTEPEQTVLVAKGGRGGRGNSRFATAQKRAPQFCEPGEPGIERELELELKLIADVGLLGMPNAGKSTLISVISSAKPKIADYPFTTLVPHLGVVKKVSGDGFVVADIPGLIEGASDGIGLGHEFLRHVERCRFLIHVVDISQDDPVGNYEKINNELKKHSERLGNLYQVIALNKTDIISQEECDKYLGIFKKFSPDVFLVSAATKENINTFLNFISQKVDEIPKPDFKVDIDEDFAAFDNDDSAYSIYRIDKNTYSVEGGKLIRLANVTDTRNIDQLYRFQNIMASMDVYKALKEAGIKDGRVVKIGQIQFEYCD